MFMQRLIGKRDHTAIIAHSLCFMEVAIFQEVASGGEAQRTLRGTCWCSRHASKEGRPFCVFPLARYILLEEFERSLQTIRAISLALNEGQKTGNLSGLVILQANARLQDLS